MGFVVCDSSSDIKADLFSFSIFEINLKVMKILETSCYF